MTDILALARDVLDRVDAGDPCPEAKLLAAEVVRLHDHIDRDNTSDRLEAHENRLNEIADALGDETEWSNLNDRGVNALELAHQAVTALATHEARAAKLRAEFETDDPDTIIATMRMVIAECDRMQDERDAARADMEATEQRWAGTLDATFAVGDGTAQREIERLRAELERMRPVVVAAVELRRSDAGDHVVDGMSIAEATVAVEENAQKSLALLTRWRSAVDAYRSKS